MAADPTPPTPEAPSNTVPDSSPTASAQQTADAISTGYLPNSPYTAYAPYPDAGYAPPIYPYAAPGYYPWMYAPPAPQLSSWALTSMICGIISMVIPQPTTAILALIYGYIALREVKKSGGQVDGHGMAIAGIVMGYIGIGFTVLLIALYIVYFVVIISTLGSYPD